MYFFILPMQLSFDFFYDIEFEIFCENQNIDDSLSKFIVWLPEMILIIDTLLKFISGFYENGVMVIEKKHIIEHYLKKGLLFDLLAYLPVLTHSFLIYYVNGTIIKLFQMLMFCKVKRVAIALSTFQEIISSNGKGEYMIGAVRLLLMILFITHLNACAWHAIAYFSDDNQNWLSSANLMTSSWKNRYLMSFFWAISLFGSMGFGKITPQNDNEYEIGICIVLVSTMLFGYSLYNVFHILKAMQSEKKEYK
jgi:potassium voltage-gated channel Eag-related subfamily H protein 7